MKFDWGYALLSNLMFIPFILMAYEKFSWYAVIAVLITIGVGALLLHPFYTKHPQYKRKNHESTVLGWSIRMLILIVGLVIYNQTDNNAIILVAMAIGFVISDGLARPKNAI